MTNWAAEIHFRQQDGFLLSKCVGILLNGENYKYTT